MGKHTDADGDGLADRPDLQSSAYRENDDPTPDDEIFLHAETIHIGAGSIEDVRLPDYWEEQVWDAEREDPR